MYESAQRPLAADFLLLAVNDLGKFSPLNPQQPICFLAAALGELAAAGCVRLEGERIAALAPPGEALRPLKPLYGFIDRPRPVPLAMILRDFDPKADGPKLAELEEAAGEALEAAGLAAPSRARSGRVYYLPKAGLAAAGLARLVYALGGSPTARDAALAVLLAQSGVLAQKAGPAQAAKAEKALAALLPTGSEAARAAHAAQETVDLVNRLLAAR